MMGQNAGRLVDVTESQATLPQMPDQLSNGRSSADKCRRVLPFQQISVHIALENSCALCGATARAFARHRPEAALQEQRQKRVVEVIPRRHEYRLKESAKQGRHSFPALAKLFHDVIGGTIAGIFSSHGGRAMIRVMPSMLENGNSLTAVESFGERLRRPA